MPNFQDVSFTSRDVVDTATWLVGLPYDEKTTYVEWDENGQPRGHCNCWGLLLVVCERLELIGPEFWTWLHFSIARRGVAQTLRRVLGHLMVRVSSEEARRGDVLLFRWTGDFREWKTEEEAVEGAFHHIGFLTSRNLSFMGAMVHAVETKADLSGRVLHSPIAPHDLSQLHSVWRFPQLYASSHQAKHCYKELRSISRLASCASFTCMTCCSKVPSPVLADLSLTKSLLFIFTQGALEPL